MEMSLQSNLDKVLEQYLDREGNMPSQIKKTFDNRHPSSIHMIKALAPNPNLSNDLYTFSQSCWDLGFYMFSNLPDGPELTAGLRKLLEAKDCFVRASLDTRPVSYTDR